jgi:hypothetical protein
VADNEGARKAGKFMAIYTTPDVCKTPVGITVVPIPYPIISNLSDSMSTSSNVNFGGDPAYIHDRSKISKVTGDEPGTAGGVKSGTNRSIVETISGSSSVNVNRKPVVRHGDPCKMNNGNTMGKVIYQGTGKSASGISADSNPPVKPETPQEEEAKEEKKGLWSRMSEGVHTALDVAGFIPGLGAIPDLANAAIYGLEGNAAMAALSVVAAVPGIGDGVKAGTMVVKGGKAIARQAAKKTAKKLTREAAEKAEKELAEKAVTEKTGKEAAKKAAQESTEQAAKKKGKDGAKVKGKKSNETGKCGEWLAKMDMLAEKRCEEVVSVQNKSGHGVDLIGRKSDGSVLVWEVKTTETAKAPGLSKDQRELGGKRYAGDRLADAAKGKGNYGKVPGLDKVAEKAQDWLRSAEKRKSKVTYEKREVFVDDISKGCGKHPTRKSRSKPWIGKDGNI